MTNALAYTDTINMPRRTAQVPARRPGITRFSTGKKLPHDGAKRLSRTGLITP